MQHCLAHKADWDRILPREIPSSVMERSIKEYVLSGHNYVNRQTLFLMALSRSLTELPLYVLKRLRSAVDTEQHS